MSWIPVPEFMRHAIHSTLTATPRPGLQPIPGSSPLTIEAVICPVILYYLALLFLPPSPPSAIDATSIHILRNVLAILAAFLFLRLPLAYHVPQSIGLTYQLGLVGLYGGLRVLDAFYVSYYFWGHIPRRVRYVHKPRPETPRGETAPRPWADGGQNGMLNKPEEPGLVKKAKENEVLQNAAAVLASTKEDTKAQEDELLAPTKPRRASLQRGLWRSDMVENMNNESFTERLSSDVGYTELMHRLMQGPKPVPVIESAETEDDWPHSFSDRASWALELELSMRGVGFTWTTADVRHTRKTWLPTVSNRVHSILFHVGPVMVVAFGIIKTAYTRRIAPIMATANPPNSPFDELSYPEQYILTAALGAFLMAAFSLGHSLFAIMLAPLAPSPLAFFPPLYTTRVWDIKSARDFWSYGWHRLFARLFLVWGVWPGEWLERKLTGKSSNERADVGKVLGGFLSSAFVHSFAVRGTLGGSWKDATGEAKFFAMNGVAVIFEEAVKGFVRRLRKSRGVSPVQWYDAWVGRVWWIALLLTTGRNFARGWTKAGLVREMAFM
ncbi:hypothetical protein WHR41_03864 [Cladosporium halotolerans]|uniref:Wax synthase domain-containing protein n=1 Tax=Cladosporium halotolerans TaxID=1052096 RepID=A0AB34KWE0_9PEZI